MYYYYYPTLSDQTFQFGDDGNQHQIKSCKTEKGEKTKTTTKHKFLLFNEITQFVFEKKKRFFFILSVVSVNSSFLYINMLFLLL